jgi:hypothetical protein
MSDRVPHGFVDISLSTDSHTHIVPIRKLIDPLGIAAKAMKELEDIAPSLSHTRHTQPTASPRPPDDSP